MNWKYKEAYELLADWIFNNPNISVNLRTNLSEELDEIFGEDRRC